MANAPDPLDEAPDPTADTPDAEAEDTAEDGDSGQTDWEARYKEAQKVISRQGNELSILRTGDEDADEPDEDDHADDDPEPEHGLRVYAPLSAAVSAARPFVSTGSPWETRMRPTGRSRRSHT